MKRVVFVCLFMCGLLTLPVFAGNQNKSGSSDGLWTEVGNSFLQQTQSQTALPDAYRVFSLNEKSLKSMLSQAPQEFTAAAGSNPLILTLPMPDGTMARFRVEHSLVVEPGLLEKFPELSETYRGQGIDDPTATVRFDFLPSGFHSMILSANGTVIVDPYSQEKSGNYISYFKRDAHPSENFSCHLGEASFQSSLSSVNSSAKMNDNKFLSDASLPNAPNVASGTMLRNYRLALSATGEYTQAVGGGTKAGALAAQVLIMNRVNGVYERDLAIHMNIIANNDLIIYTDGTTDPFTNDDGNVLIDENQTNTDSIIKTANYDIGHVFSTGGGGIAGVGVPCRAASKANGVTGLPNPIGDAFAIDYVAHEMGHQFGAQHTFNGAISNCGNGNRTRTSAFEPGSGITIMAYAGICGNQDLAIHSIDTFHVKSLEAIVAYSQTGMGNSCAAPTATGNTAPTITSVGGTTFNIPKQTPFALTAAATDPNGDTVTYDWQEYDIPPTGATGSGTVVPNTDSDNVRRPIFRPYAPTVSGTRIFPALTYILNNANVPPSTYDCGRSAAAGPCMTGELLPAITRPMVFQAIARDNRASGGGINTVTDTVNIDGNSGPFVVTSPNTNVNWNEGTMQTVTWDVANTTASPVSAANVNILLSTDGGQTFPTTLAANTPNDGSQVITIPTSFAALATSTARIKVEGAGKIFFDISDTNFTINAPTAAGVSVSGRVLAANGTGVARARISMTNQQGATVSVSANSFGFYRFDDVPSGASYVFSITDKKYKFNTTFLSLNDNVAEYNFTALP